MRKPRAMLRMAQIRKHNAFLLRLIEITESEELCKLYESGLILNGIDGRTILKSPV